MYLFIEILYRTHCYCTTKAIVYEWIEWMYACIIIFSFSYLLQDVIVLDHGSWIKSVSLSLSGELWAAGYLEKLEFKSIESIGK